MEVCTWDIPPCWYRTRSQFWLALLFLIITTNKPRGGSLASQRSEKLRKRLNSYNTIGKVLYDLCKAFPQALSPLKANGLAPVQSTAFVMRCVLRQRRFGSYPGNGMCIDPTEKDGQGTSHHSRRGAWSEAKKEVVGVGAASSSLCVYRRVRRRQNSDGWEAAPNADLPGLKPTLSFSLTSSKCNGNNVAGQLMLGTSFSVH